ncbi:hypothetical protein OHA21_51430 [Actinoplanes sp. NBC_00393]|uniref:hypothetical protein n=1 Tax=Actinoplanes sp. NBC_00393 TaxID=2975953 RepID=UPI002E1CA65A
MEPARPLRDVFADLTGAGNATGDPADLLRDQGHALPDDLVAEAVVSYADTAPAEVAEHLAPYVTAHSVVGAADGTGDETGWLELLATAPAGAEPGDIDELTPVTGGFDDTDPGTPLDFGTGTDAEPAVETTEVDLPGGDDITETDEFLELELGADPIALDIAADEEWVDGDGDDDEPDTETLG